ncbi:MAG: hypothetical protein FD156_2483 [Nitrospirae bacterium]|nr:MAG: hypothetical protein FD156_2483 [Nitrospirota bacterium]
MAKYFINIICFILLTGTIVCAENPVPKDTLYDIGRYQLFQGTYTTFDLKNGQSVTSNGVFLLDTKTGSVKRYLNKIDEDGSYIETWIPTEVQTKKKQEGK